MTIKAYTDLPQSKILAEILPLESADMSYRPYREEGGISDYQADLCPYNFASWIGIPCWSLSALLGVLPFPILYMEMVTGMILWCCECHFLETGEEVKIEHYDNPVDACVNMILKLHEQKLL